MYFARTTNTADAPPFRPPLAKGGEFAALGVLLETRNLKLETQAVHAVFPLPFFLARSAVLCASSRRRRWSASRRRITSRCS